jgi:hypothetical protein
VEGQCVAVNVVPADVIGGRLRMRIWGRERLPGGCDGLKWPYAIVSDTPRRAFFWGCCRRRTWSFQRSSNKKELRATTTTNVFHHHVGQPITLVKKAWQHYLPY